MRFEDQHIVVTGAPEASGAPSRSHSSPRGSRPRHHRGNTEAARASRTPRAPTPRASISRLPTRPTTGSGLPSGGSDPGVGARRQLRDPPGRDPRHDVARRLGRRPARQPHRRVRDGEVRRAEHDAAALAGSLHDVAGGRFGFEGQGNYSASKAGQVGLMRSLCKEVAKRKITVNCVCRGSSRPSSRRPPGRAPGRIPQERAGEAIRDAGGGSPPRSSTSRPPRRVHITGATLDITETRADVSIHRPVTDFIPHRRRSSSSIESSSTRMSDRPSGRAEDPLYSGPPRRAGASGRVDLRVLLPGGRCSSTRRARTTRTLRAPGAHAHHRRAVPAHRAPGHTLRARVRITERLANARYVDAQVTTADGAKVTRLSCVLAVAPLEGDQA